MTLAGPPRMLLRMRVCVVTAAAVFSVGLLASCHRSPPAEAKPAATRTVFTDSLLHAEHCAPTKPGEDWRKVCTPLDQALFIRKLP